MQEARPAAGPGVARRVVRVGYVEMNKDPSRADHAHSPRRRLVSGEEVVAGFGRRRRRSGRQRRKMGYAVASDQPHPADVMDGEGGFLSVRAGVRPRGGTVALG
jgi:hypothetical protein